MRGLRYLVMAGVLLAALSVAGAPPLETETLKDIAQINWDGFGDEANKYSFSMVSYKGHLYVGTLNIKGMLGMARFFTGTDGKRASEGAEVWRYDEEQAWTQVVDGGLGRPTNIGVRKMSVIGDCIWAVTANHNEGMEVWRTCDGVDWEVLVDNGFGNRKNTSGRGLGHFGGYVYVGLENREQGAQLWRTRDGDEWEMVADKGIADPGNVWVSDFAEFQGRLYMGTLNIGGGFQLFRTRDGRHFEKVAENGIDKRTNMAAMKLIEFDGKLLVSTMDFFKGYDLYASEDGVNFKRVLAHGYTDSSYAYLWQMQEYNGRLYAGTFQHILPLPKGRFSLMSSEDGVDWLVENSDGFDSEWNYGIRSMAVHQGKLIVGTASPQAGTRVFAASGK